MADHPVEVHRIRHGVYADGVFGFRAVRMIDGTREWIGPWRQLEADADADVDAAKQALVAATAAVGGDLVEYANPDIGKWQPTPQVR